MAADVHADKYLVLLRDCRELSLVADVGDLGRVKTKDWSMDNDQSKFPFISDLVTTE